MAKSSFKFGSDKGSILIIVALLMPLFILLTGFVVDIGRAFMYKEEINKACMVAAEEASKRIDIDAAQEFGVNRLTEDYSNIINKYFYRNYDNDSGCSINYLSYNVMDNIDNPKYIEVYCEANVECFFLKMISIDNIDIHTKANGRLRKIK
ncbi:MAG: pilus assembly protein [Actinomycetota bacterium]|nr:pilus assembly protein [Actinomycetota bacterium]